MASTAAVAGAKPWEGGRLSAPPTGPKDHWKVMESGGAMWIMKRHVKPRWQPFHSLKGTLPCGAAADLELMRVQARFGPNGNRRVLQDSWMDPVLQNGEEKWTGYTLF